MGEGKGGEGGTEKSVEFREARVLRGRERACAGGRQALGSRCAGGWVSVLAESRLM